MSRTPYDVDVAAPAPKPLEIDELNKLWEDDNPYSLKNVLPAALFAYFDRTRKQYPHLFDIPEDQLRRKIKDETKDYPSSTENQLRLRLWYEINLAIANDESEIGLRRVCAGVCALPTFYHYMKRPYAVAWLCCMPMSFELHLEDMINTGSAWAARVLRLDDIDPTTGKINTKLMSIKANLLQAAEMRRLGGIPQLTKNLNYNATTARSANESLEVHGDKITDLRITEMLGAQKRKLVSPAPELTDEEKPSK